MPQMVPLMDTVEEEALEATGDRMGGMDSQDLTIQGVVAVVSRCQRYLSMLIFSGKDKSYSFLE